MRGWVPELLAALALAEIGGRVGFTRAASSLHGVVVQQQTSAFIVGSPVRLTGPSLVVLLALCVLMTVSLRLRPSAAVIVITAAVVVSLAVFQVLVVGGLCAQVVVAYRAGRSAGWPAASAPTGRASPPSPSCVRGRRSRAPATSGPAPR